jgi:predicted metalloprotease
MNLDSLKESDDIQDLRGSSRMATGGKMGLGSLIIAAVAYFVFGVNPSTTLSGLNSVQSMGGSGQTAPGQVKQNDAQSVLASKILQSTKDVWTAQFAKQGLRYQAPIMVLYQNRTATACGTGQSAAGPFYCPGDQKIYLDLLFFQQMSQQMNASGDFAQAYVIAHEVGHHVQNLLGIEQKVAQMRARGSQAQANALSVRLELQADCFAGVWAAQANAKQPFLEKGDVEEGLNAAHQIGDDTLQKQAQGYAVPDSFTHGSSAQRMNWFGRGLKTGDMGQCNTFASGTI